MNLYVKASQAPSWTGPAVQRRVDYLDEQERKKKETGYFTDEQLRALAAAQKEIPSNTPGYWGKIARRVPGQTPETCKKMVQQRLYNKGMLCNFRQQEPHCAFSRRRPRQVLRGLCRCD